MKSSLALFLVLVSFSVLTAAKPEWVSKYKHHHHHHSQHYHHNGHHTCRQRTTHSHSLPTIHPGTPNTYSGAPSSTGTPTSSVTPKVAPTTYSSGWVQNSKGNASFTAYSGCQSACKSCAHFHGHSPQCPRCV